jgi:hypothetical protein
MEGDAAAAADDEDDCTTTAADNDDDEDVFTGLSTSLSLSASRWWLFLSFADLAGGARGAERREAEAKVEGSEDGIKTAASEDNGNVVAVVVVVAVVGAVAAADEDDDDDNDAAENEGGWGDDARGAARGRPP